MAIVKMKKFTLLAFEPNKDKLLKELQKFGDVHFRNLQKGDLEELKFLSRDTAAELNTAEAELNKIKFSMNKIEPYAVKPKGVKAMTAAPETLEYDEFDSYLETYDYNKVYDTLKSEDERINAAKSEITRLRAENDSLRPWLRLDVSLEELDRLKFVRYLIGTVSKVAADSFSEMAEKEFGTAHIEFLGNIKDDTAMLIIVPAEAYDDAFAYFKTLGFSRLTLSFKGIPSELVNVNNERISSLQTAQSGAAEAVKALSGEYAKLRIAHDYYETLLERERACGNFLKTQAVVVIEGWVPGEESQTLRDIAESVCGGEYCLEEEEVPSDSEDVPIKLKNNKMVAAFEDVTSMFSMPKYNEIDPTPVLMPFYMLFFGLMVGDAGYGLLMLIGTSVALKFFNLKPGGRKFIQFFFYLSFATIFGGIIYGSMFGFSFFTPILTDDGTYKAILDAQADVLPMLIASVAIGVVHVLSGLGVKGYMLIKSGRPLAAVFDSLFYIVTLISGISWLLSGFTDFIPGTVSSISMWVFFASLFGLLLTQGRESNSLGGKIASGFYAVYGLSGYIGDLVSYTRIAALALSGAYIAFSFNLMAGLIPMGPFGIFRFLFGGAILVLGQALNIGLGLLGAYVHTCRLQYVEFFGKFYEGGGIPFAAFKIKNNYIQIKK